MPQVAAQPRHASAAFGRLGSSTVGGEGGNSGSEVFKTSRDTTTCDEVTCRHVVDLGDSGGGGRGGVWWDRGHGSGGSEGG